MKRLKLLRVSNSLEVTYGVLLDTNTGLPMCLILEEPWRSNKSDISCIPEGIYKVKARNDEKYPFQVMEVLNRTGVYIHIGNNLNDTTGCLLPGMTIGEYKEVLAVLDSRIALERLKDYVNNQDFELEVTS